MRSFEASDRGAILMMRCGSPTTSESRLEATRKTCRTALSRALTTCDAFDLAERQGYHAPAIRERCAAVAVEGVTAGVDLVVIASR